MEKITLSYPIDHDGEVIKELTMRRPQVRDHLAAEKAGSRDIDVEITMFANLCEVSTEVIQKIEAGADLVKLQKVYAGFFTSPRES